jgi:hypothetical protein
MSVLSYDANMHSITGEQFNIIRNRKISGSNSDQ